MPGISRAQARSRLANAFASRGWVWESTIGTAIIEASESLGPTTPTELAEAADDGVLAAVHISRQELASALADVFDGEVYVDGGQRDESIGQRNVISARGDINISNSSVGNFNYVRDAPNDWPSAVSAAFHSYERSGTLPLDQVVQADDAISSLGLDAESVAAMIQTRMTEEISRSEQFENFVRDVAANLSGSVLAAGLLAAVRSIS